MPYGLAVAIIGFLLVIVFATFAYLLVNARSLAALFKPVSGGEIKVGQGSAGISKRKALIALILHFAAWGLAGLVWLYTLADIRATGPDTTPLEEAGIVDGKTKSAR